MNIHYFAKLSTRLFSPLIAIFILVLLTLIIYVPGVTKEQTINTAIASAEGTVKQYKAIQSNPWLLHQEYYKESCRQ